MKTNYTFQNSWLKIAQQIFGIFLLCFMFAEVNLQAQTTPSPQTLPYSQDFSSFDGTVTAFPAGWQAGQVSTSAPSSAGRTAIPTVDKSIVGGTAASNSSGAYDFNGKIGFLSTAGSDVVLCLALNTTGKSNIKIAFDVMTIRNLWDGVSASSGYQNGLVLQYRVGTGATLFTSLPYAPAEYLSGSTVQTTAVTTGINPVTGLNAFLPAACENQSVVQVRWIYRNVAGGTSGSRPSMALDNIVVNEVPITFTSGWPKAENATAGGFTAKSNINTPGTTYFVVLENGANMPTVAQIKAGQDASASAVAANKKGTITNTNGATEYLAAVTGLLANTTYDVYFVAEGNSGMSLQAASQKITITTTNSSVAPTIVNPTVSSILNTTGVNTATLGGNITSDGGSAIIEKGTVWKTANGVTIDDNKLAEGTTSTGVFSSSRTGFPSKTKIYYKAYATNAINTSFTDESSFYTIADEPTSAVGSFVSTPTESSSTSLDLSWTTATGADGYIIIIRSGSTGPGTIPSDLTLYSVGAGIGTGTVAAVVNSGTATSQTITGLVSNQLYTIRIYPFGFDGTNAETINYAGALYQSTTGTTSIGTAFNSLNSNIKLSVSNNNVLIYGAKYQNMLISSLTGQLVVNKLITTDNEKINLKNGFYIIRVGDKRFKIQVNE